MAINIAFDRSQRRYGDGFGRTMADLRRLVATLRADGCRVTVVGHCAEDMLFHALLPDAAEVGTMNLADADVQRAAAFYAGVDLAIGMRTHAQLIPFALGTPILSLISHDKMAWALDDLDVRSWGVEIGDVEFLDKALAVARDILAHPDAARRRVIDLRAALFAQTESNLRQIERMLPPVTPTPARRKP